LVFTQGKDWIIAITILTAIPWLRINNQSRFYVTLMLETYVRTIPSFLILIYGTIAWGCRLYYFNFGESGRPKLMAWQAFE